MTLHLDSKLSFNMPETRFGQSHSNLMLEMLSSAKPRKSQDIETMNNEIVIAMARWKPGSG